MEDTAYAQAKAAAFRVLSAPELQGKVFLEGGLVPWVISGNDSGRKHDDTDFSVREKDLPAVREWLRGQELYDSNLDSFNLKCNADKVDFGVHALIDDVMVSFAPFKREGTLMIQRNAVHESFAGYDALFEARIEGLEEQDFVEMRTLSDGTVVGMSTIEAVRAAKVGTDREKDLLDLAEIDSIGYDEETYARVLAAFETIVVECPAHGE